MFGVGVSGHCMVAHSFADPFFGPAQRLHGATYAVRVEVRAAALGPHDVVMDIATLVAIVRHVLAEIDYSNLDDHPAFHGGTSTTERVAAYLADRIAAEIGKLPGDGRPAAPAELDLEIHESPGAWATYRRALP